MYRQCAGIVLLTVFFTGVSIARSVDGLRLGKEYLITETTVKTDTIVRFYRYNASGVLSSIVDSPRVNNLYIPTYEARCDGIGRIVWVHFRRNAPDLPEYTPQGITIYHWLADNRVSFASRDTDEALLDSGYFQTAGKIRFLRLPQNESYPTLSEKGKIVIVSDSTALYKADGTLVSTYFWQFDSLGTDTVLSYKLPGGKKQWMQSYTNKYYPNGLLYKRFPAMEGTASTYLYFTTVSALAVLGREGECRSRFPRDAGTPFPFRKAFLLNGRSLPSSVSGSMAAAWLVRDVRALSVSR